MHEWGPAVLVLFGILGGVLYNNSRIADMRTALDERITDLKSSINREFELTRELFRSEVKRLKEKIEGHPVG